jgi:hypothetical protein
LIALDDLDTLLREAANADGTYRIQFRDRIAAFGPEAIVRLEPWLSDPRLGAFAVWTIEHAAAMPGAALMAKTALRRASATGPIHDDIEAALVRLRVRARSSGSLTARPTNTPRGRRSVNEVFRDLRDLLVENAARGQLLSYSDTGLDRSVVGKLLDDINRSEHEQGRPLLSVIVVPSIPGTS